MDIELVVRHPFADYVIGDRITDTGKIKEALEHNPDKVGKVARQQPEAPAEKPAEAPSKA